MTMSKYEIILYWSDEDEAFIAEVPELSGCMANGKTYHEALQHVEVIKLGIRVKKSSREVLQFWEK